MARVRNDQLSEEEKKKISKIISKLFEDYKDKNPGITQKEIGEITGISKSSINRIFNENSEDNFITLKNLIKISEFFNVNIDYLIGNEKDNIRSRDITNRAISKRLKLSDEAINNMLSIKDKLEVKALNDLLSSDYLSIFLEDLSRYLYSDLIINGFITYYPNYEKKEKTEKLDIEKVDIVFLEALKEDISNIKEDLNNGKKK